MHILEQVLQDTAPTAFAKRLMFSENRHVFILVEEETFETI